MDVVVPLGGQTETPGRSREEHPWIVEIALRDQRQRTPQFGRQRVRRGGQFLEEVDRTMVGERVDGVES